MGDAGLIATHIMRAPPPSRPPPCHVGLLVTPHARARPARIGPTPLRLVLLFLPHRFRWQCSLTDLDLTYATNDAGGARVARALQSNRSLTRLNLSNNRLSNGAGIALAEALRLNHTLTHANLAGNLLTDAAAVTLAASLASHAVLTRLDLGRNTINAIGAQALRQCLHSNHTLTSLGDLASLPIATGLRASLEWYLRNNAERLESLRVDATRAAEQQEGLLKMLPPEEKALRQKIFKLEDESLRLTKERDAQDAEAAQVNALLTATIQRNAELVDAVATLQGQVDQLRKDALGKRSKSARAKLRKEADKAEKMAEKGVASGPPASRVGSSGGGKKEGGATAGGGTVGAGGRKLGAAAAGSRAAALSKIAAVREAQMAAVRQRAAMTPRQLATANSGTADWRGELPSGGIGGRGRGTGVGRGAGSAPPPRRTASTSSVSAAAARSHASRPGASAADAAARDDALYTSVGEAMTLWDEAVAFELGAHADEAVDGDGDGPLSDVPQPVGYGVAGGAPIVSPAGGGGLGGGALLDDAVGGGATIEIPLERVGSGRGGASGFGGAAGAPPPRDPRTAYEESMGLPPAAGDAEAAAMAALAGIEPVSPERF